MKPMIDILWVILCAGLVFMMQAGFLCLETGLTRTKNSVDVAIKNLVDFSLSTIIFWLLGYALMFGSSAGGILGLSHFVPDFKTNGMWFTTFFIFQAMFCGTAVTILSGALAERIRFYGYLLITALVAGLTYPIFGHWAWGGLLDGTTAGWLAQQGFVDFAGATVVHSVGGWTALALLLIVGARDGRFPTYGAARRFKSSNIPLASLGVLLLYSGWIGFNGGSALTLDNNVPIIIVNTVIAGAMGMLSPVLIDLVLLRRTDVEMMMNGCLAGLVAVTAGCFAFPTIYSALVGFVGGLVMLGTTHLLEQYKIDDAVDAIPVHLGAGIWGTLAVGLFADLETLGTGLTRPEQITAQLLGIVVCGFWVFTTTYILARWVNGLLPLRVSPADERLGLNLSEHSTPDQLGHLL